MTNDEKILGFLETLQSDVTLMKGDMVVMKGDIANVKLQMATKADLAAVKRDVQDVQGEQVSMFAFLQENVATKRDLEEAKSEMMTHIDGLAAHNQKFDQELLMIRNRQDRLEARMA